MVWAQKNTLNEGHVFVVQGVFDPKQLNIKTCKEISGNEVHKVSNDFNNFTYV